MALIGKVRRSRYLPSRYKRISGSIALATLDPGARKGVFGQRHAPAVLLWENDPVPIGSVYIYIYIYI